MKRISQIMVLIIIFITAAAGAATVSSRETAAEYEYRELRNQLLQILKKEKGTYGIFVIDLKSGKSLGINHLETFHAASTFKLPLNLYLYEKIAEGKVDPNIKLVYRKEHYEDGTGLLKYKPVGSVFSIETLSKYSIVYSDNIATNMLLSYLGRSNVKDYMRSMGGTIVNDNKNITCPRDMALYMLKLLDFTSEHPELGNKIIGYLENTIYNERIPKLLPPNIKIAHKIGNWPPTGTYNDVGYVEHPENPYIIAIFSKNTPDINTAFKVIQKISKVVYNYQSKLVKISLLINGSPLKADVPPILENNSVLVPLRAVSTALGAGVQWDGLNKTITITKPGRKIFLKIDDYSAGLNNTTISLAASPKIIDGRTMVPLRFISEALGAVVNWNNATKTVTVDAKE